MSVFDLFKKQIEKADKKPRLVFPEGRDFRVLEAAVRLNNEKLVEVTLLGNENEIRQLAADNNFRLDGIKLIDPNNYDDFDEMCGKFVEIRNGKNTLEDAKKMLKSVSYFGTMLVKMGQADGMISGAAHSTADTVRPALQIVKTAPGMHRVSGVMIMERGDERYIFSDCAMNIDPDSDTLAEIGYQAAKIAKMAEIDPKIAFLSFSTKGSAKGPQVEKVVEAVNKFKQDHPDIPADGELQFDAAIVPEVGERKAPDSKVAGHANVFIFPELQSGNIGYKIAQRLGNFSAVGPVLEGLAAPINDLSRGASSEDVYLMGILTAAQSLAKD
ncbi:phosphate acetyltransferase [Lactobacillus intestinalis]|uniref:Phosphate acetyltransferase n=1 Tax=Lactobacillus intestinalis DSM 6629 TaxID=1423761 RepID=A0ABR5PRV9_9LACO|nr:phosphate acetyltransferase [Lactobacillus intestinalis]KRM32349.1 phosphate acetyltransferase [Lactobacillus intestinalis DSM 6629]UTW39872.1 phosphate acetyltransferase [Lactobacillus intestinalis]